MSNVHYVKSGDVTIGEVSKTDIGWEYLCYSTDHGYDGVDTKEEAINDCLEEHNGSFDLAIEEAAMALYLVEQYMPLDQLLEKVKKHIEKLREEDRDVEDVGE